MLLELPINIKNDLKVTFLYQKMFKLKMYQNFKTFLSGRPPSYDLKKKERKKRKSAKRAEPVAIEKERDLRLKELSGNRNECLIDNRQKACSSVTSVESWKNLPWSLRAPRFIKVWVCVAELWSQNIK